MTYTDKLLLTAGATLGGAIALAAWKGQKGLGHGLAWGGSAFLLGTVIARMIPPPDDSTTPALSGASPLGLLPVSVYPSASKLLTAGVQRNRARPLVLPSLRKTR